MTSLSIARRSVPSTGMAYGLLAALIWGTWPVVSRLGVAQTLTPYDITALRFAVAGLVLLPVVWRLGAGRLGWPKALVLAAGAGVPYVLVSVGGLTFAPAGHAGVITPSCMLLFSTLGGWWLLGDRPAGRRLGGLAMVIAGVALIGGAGVSGYRDGVWIGDLMFVAGGFLWATYTVASRAWSVDPVHATALVSVLSMILYLPVYLVIGTPGIFTAPLTEVFFQGVFQGLFAAVLALLAYTRAVALLGAARGALFAALVPVVAVITALPVLGELPSAVEWLGVVAVAGGMLWALRPVRDQH